MVCALSGERLKAPIVVCDLGKLYNRSSVVEFLLGEGVFVNNRDELKKNGFGHITSIKNVIEVRLTPNETIDDKKDRKNSETTAKEAGLFICPVTQLETNGMHSFCALRTCGHVFSEKALNLFQELTACWTCNTPYTKEDIIAIHPNEKNLAEMEARVKERMEREKEKKDKKDKKRKRREEKEQEKEKEKKGDEKRLAIEGPKDKPTSEKTKASRPTTTTTTTTTTSTTIPVDTRVKVAASK